MVLRSVVRVPSLREGTLFAGHLSSTAPPRAGDSKQVAVEAGTIDIPVDLLDLGPASEQQGAGRRGRAATPAGGADGERSVGAARVCVRRPRLAAMSCR